MATISSIGIGSGLDVNSIVSQLVALEKQPLTALTTAATKVQAQISAFGTVQSQFSALSDVATRIADPTTWSARTASSSSSSNATITADASAAAATFSLDVDQLAKTQSISSAAISPTTTLGAGTLTIQLGTWATNAAAGTTTFAPGSNSAVNVTVGATDSLATIAASINAAGAGVTASVFNDGTNNRLLLQSTSTGAASGFQVKETDGGSNLSGLVFDPQTTGGSPGTGMAAAGIPVQYAQDAAARINGLAVTSPTNTLTGKFAGITVNLLATTTTNYGSASQTSMPLTMHVTEDVTPAVKNVQDFVTAYNTLSASLADLTKYDSTTSTGAIFQGDSAVLGLQSILRSMVSSTSTGSSVYKYLSDVGLEVQRDGSLTINTGKLSAAANNGTELQNMFTTNNNNPSTNGFAVKFRDLSQGVLAAGGLVTNETAALQGALTRNAADQTKVNDHATAFEARLRAQYTALDTQMASLTALNSYVSQQVTTWNKSTA
ncbi:flagellar hook-associated protein 2 [mine drainage metagenome]|uniref:Filament cap protein n=1 Tax=mine drainage metagenome TaxID=410659 RepID=A0A1J5Q2S1_9ZZZZ